MLLALGVCSQCDKIRPGDPIAVPDEGFLAALIAKGVDTNGDGSISVAEAEAVTRLEIPFDFEPGTPWIESLKGIEWFVNLEYLDCSLYRLKTLDFSHNPALKELYCNHNGLNHLDISKNTRLEILDCSSNDSYLDCPDCGIRNLDVSNNIHLIRLSCYNCRLSRIN